MRKDNHLRRIAADAIRAGKLPPTRPDRMWGGPGSGADCTICDRPLEPDELEIELEFRGGADHGERGSVRVHTRCFAAWEFASQNFDVARGPLPARDENCPPAGAALRSEAN